MTENTTPTGNFIVYHNGPHDEVIAVPKTQENMLTAKLHHPVTIVFAESREDALSNVNNDKDFVDALAVKKAEANRVVEKQENTLDGLKKMRRRLVF